MKTAVMIAAVTQRDEARGARVARLMKDEQTGKPRAQERWRMSARVIVRGIRLSLCLGVYGGSEGLRKD